MKKLTNLITGSIVSSTLLRGKHWGCERNTIGNCCSGYTLHVLAIRPSWLWAFRFYPAARQQLNIVRQLLLKK